MKYLTKKYLALIFSVIFLITSLAFTKTDDVNTEKMSFKPCHICDMGGCNAAGGSQIGTTGCDAYQIPGHWPDFCVTSGEECNVEPQLQ